LTKKDKHNKRRKQELNAQANLGHTTNQNRKLISKQPDLTPLYGVKSGIVTKIYKI
jgi:hypothetical protein